jgi:transcriptional regulator with XRE-family HTH domain
MIAVSVHKRPKPRFPLAEILARKRLSQYQLAKRTRLSTCYINRIATGKQLPGWKVILLISHALDLNIGDLGLNQPPRV